MSYIRRLAKAIRDRVPAELVPPDSEDLFLIYAALGRTRGDATSARDVHDAWVAWMEIHRRRHRSMRPFEELPNEVRREDEPFVEAIRAALRQP